MKNKKIWVLPLISLLAAGAQAGWHFGESKDLGLDIQYLDYAYLRPDGEPVYYLGSTMRYKITLTNNGNRKYNHFQAKSILLWAGDASCQRWWLDNQNVNFSKDTLLPGNADSGLRQADMDKQASVSYEALYPIPLELCPGEAYIQIQGRHQNNSGRDETASFMIPLNLEIKRKD